MNDMRKEFDLARFEALVDAHGADIGRFPEGEREAAEALLARDPRARTLLDEAAAVERALSKLEPVVPSAALRRAVAEIPLRNPQPRSLEALLGWLPWRSRWVLVPCAVLLLALGAASGAWTGGRELAFAPAPPPVEDAASEDDAVLAELTELAFATELERELTP